MRGVVLEDHFDGVAHFRVQNRADDAEVRVLGRARLDRGEGGVRVFAVDRFLIDATDVVGAGLGESLGNGVEGHAHSLVAA
jgi:hypothetical protein